MSFQIGNINGKFDYAFFVNLENKGKKSILEWCIGMNLISKRYECPNCHLQMVLEERKEIEDGYVWICRQEGRDQHCDNFELSVRKGSFLERSPLSIITIFLLTYLWIKKATSSFIEDELMLSKDVIIDWTHFMQEVCVDICIRNSNVIGGEGLIVEIIESDFKNQKYIENDKAIGKWVYIGFEKVTDKGFYAVVPKRSKKSFVKIIEDYVSPGSVLVSESWKEYDFENDDSFIDLKESKEIKFERLNVEKYGSFCMRRSIKHSNIDCKGFSCDFHLYLAEYLFRRTNSDISYEIMRSFFKEVIKIYQTS